MLLKLNQFYYNSLFTKLKANGRANLFKTHRDQPDEELNVPTILDQLVIRGSVNKVVDSIVGVRIRPKPAW